ncbi:MAG: DNA polymerase/3'-5' exonuclease PolX [Candidatus Thorarchaeota archaeon]|nr:DNA polymerase/3'-5' exonuclease PolX [Candidatus Thorarchaeota archaeon]
MKNQEIAKALHEIGVLLEIEGKDKFKPRAYARAARSLESLGEDIESIAQRGELEAIPGIGKAIAKKIEEYLETGTIATLEKLRKKIPIRVSELEAIPGVGPKTIKILYDHLKITDIESLEQALNAGLLKGLPRLGAKSIAQIAEGIALVRSGLHRTLLADAFEVAERIVEYLKGSSTLIRIEIAGSLRRRRETIGDIDILVQTEHPNEVAEAFTSFPEIADIIVQGDTKISIRLQSRLQIDLRLLPAESYGAGLQYFTGSKDHNVRLRSLAQQSGYKLNEYGLFRGDTRIAGSDEAEIYKALGLEYIPPELREDHGEIEAARNNTIPSLVEISDIRGDLHSHTNQTDGSNTIEEMIQAAEDRGFEYLCISDHTKNLTVANGMDEARILKRIEEIDELNSSGRWKLRILKGAEVDILQNGELDIDDAVLAQLDVVTVSVHTNMRMDKAAMTERICTALESRYAHILGHPTGRLLLKRPGYDIDLEAIFEVARKNNVAMEVNAYPQRLDLDAGNVRSAISHGLKIAINTDAHKTFDLDNLRYGVFQARRGWASASDVINTRSINDLLKLLKK